MRKAAITSLILAAAAYGAMGDLVASFPNSGTSSHYGLAADANYLYTYHYTSPYNIIILNKSTGSVVSSYPNPFGTSSPNYYMRGLSYWPGGYLAFNNYSSRFVAQLVASTGSIVSSWTWPSGSRYGCCVKSDGTSTGVTGIYQSYYTGSFWFSTTTGSEVSSFTMPASTYDYDDAYDYGNDYIWAPNYSTGYINAITTAGSIVTSWRVPTAVSSPYGAAYYADYLYVSTSSGTPDEYIWVYHCPNPTSNVTPASMGRVKAMYH